MTPPTSKTTMRGPAGLTASTKEPGPAGASVVTRMISPPRPPGVVAAAPDRAREMPAASRRPSANCANNSIPSAQSRFDMQCPLRNIENDTGFPI